MASWDNTLIQGILVTTNEYKIGEQCYNLARLSNDYYGVPNGQLNIGDNNFNSVDLYGQKIVLPSKIAMTHSDDHNGPEDCIIKYDSYDDYLTMNTPSNFKIDSQSFYVNASGGYGFNLNQNGDATLFAKNINISADTSANGNIILNLLGNISNSYGDINFNDNIEITGDLKVDKKCYFADEIYMRNPSTLIASGPFVKSSYDTYGTTYTFGDPIRGDKFNINETEFNIKRSSLNSNILHIDDNNVNIGLGSSTTNIDGGNINITSILPSSNYSGKTYIAAKELELATVDDGVHKRNVLDAYHYHDNINGHSNWIVYGSNAINSNDVGVSHKFLGKSITFMEDDITRFSIDSDNTNITSKNVKINSPTTAIESTAFLAGYSKKINGDDYKSPFKISNQTIDIGYTGYTSNINIQSTNINTTISSGANIKFDNNDYISYKIESGNMKNLKIQTTGHYSNTSSMYTVESSGGIYIQSTNDNIELSAEKYLTLNSNKALKIGSKNITANESRFEVFTTPSTGTYTTYITGVSEDDTYDKMGMRIGVKSTYNHYIHIHESGIDINSGDNTKFANIKLTNNGDIMLSSDGDANTSNNYIKIYSVNKSIYSTSSSNQIMIKDTDNNKNTVVFNADTHNTTIRAPKTSTIDITSNIKLDGIGIQIDAGKLILNLDNANISHLVGTAFPTNPTNGQIFFKISN